MADRVPSHVLSELGAEVRALARRRMVTRQLGPVGSWTPLEPDPVALADRCEEWSWHTPRENLATLEAEVRRVLAARPR